MENKLMGGEKMDRLLHEMTKAGQGSSIDKVMRKVTKLAAKNIVLPAAKALVPVDTSNLEDELKTKAIKRSRKKFGYWIGFDDPIFAGDTFYAGFIEFGFHVGKRDKHVRARKRKAKRAETRRRNARRPSDGRQFVEADSFLRRALYENEEEYRKLAKQELYELVDRYNRVTSYSGGY